MAQEVAVGKRLKISKAQQSTLLAVLGASVALGIGLVLSIWAIKYISFNAKVIGAKDTAIAEYSDVIKTVGICEQPKGKVYSDAELENCVPNETVAEDGTLRHEILANMAENKDLESVTRDSVDNICYKGGNKENEKLKYSYMYEQYENSTTDEERTYWLKVLSTCSALRVIPDALPANKNVEATLASLTQIFILSGVELEELGQSADTGEDDGDDSEVGEDLIIEGLKNIPIALELRTSGRNVLKVLNKIEQSIREFAVDTATVKWGGGVTELEFDVDFSAYYIDPIEIQEESKQVKASNKRGGE